MNARGTSYPSRFVFWCTAPFLLATLLLFALAVRPPDTPGWIVLAAVEAICLCVLLGLYDSQRFWWCWRVVGAIVFAGYLGYLIEMVATGRWVGNGRRSTTSALNAFLGLVVFGYPGFMYAVFGRLTWRKEPPDELLDDSPPIKAEDSDSA